MRGLLVLLLSGLGLIFFLQNRDPVLLYFLGNSDKTALFVLSLPLGLWVIGFILLGVLISLVLQILNRMGKPAKISQARSSPRPQTAPQPTRSPQPTPPPRPTEPTRSPVANNKDWEWDNPIPEAEDWEVEDLPEIPRTVDPRPGSSPLPKVEAKEDAEPIIDIPSYSERPISRPLEQPRPVEPTPPRLRSEDLKQFEVSQPPKTSTREGTIYSYTYREPRPPQSRSTRPRSPESSPSQKTSTPAKKIYDANYQVINPPLSSNAPPDWHEDEDEDWV